MSKVANHEVTYNNESKRMAIVIKESVGQIKIRIALALLLAFPERISRKELVFITDIKQNRIREYLTNPNKGVTAHIDENDSGVVLTVSGFDWAIDILESLESVQPQKMSIGGVNSVEQPTTKSEDSTETKGQ